MYVFQIDIIASIQYTSNTLQAVKLIFGSGHFSIIDRERCDSSLAAM
jgi:hypothetical protein